MENQEKLKPLNGNTIGPQHEADSSGNSSSISTGLTEKSQVQSNNVDKTTKDRPSASANSRDASEDFSNGEQQTMLDTPPDRLPDALLDDDPSSSSETNDNSQFIKEASAAALEDAILLKRSDSFLTASEGEEESSCSEEIPISPPPMRLDRRFSSASARYMEEASFEASMLSPGHHQLAPSGRLGRQHTSSSRDVIDLRSSSLSSGLGESSNSVLGASSRSALEDVDERDTGGDVGEGARPRRANRRQSEKIIFRGMSIEDSAPPPLATIEAVPSMEENLSSELHETDEVSNVLEACGLQIPSGGSSEYPADVVMLHALFKDFCQPSIGLQSVESVLEMERDEGKRSMKLPVDVVIQKPSPVLVQLLGPPLLSLPREFVMALFRILLRLLTNDTDDEYDSATLKSCPWYNETFAPPTQPSLLSHLTRKRTSSSASLKKQPSLSELSFSRSSEARKADQMYTMVRFQRNWTTAVTQILRLLESILHDEQHNYLQAPLTRLLGLLCVGGMYVEELRRILTLAAKTTSSPMTRLLLVRSMQTAASGASRSSLLMGKASPRTFFSFVSGQGIERNINLEKSSWPFKNDFGMALWFRAECFMDSSTLLRATNQAGNGTEISLLPLSSNAKGSAAANVLAITILEGGKPVHCIKVSKCVLHERVWYHVAVRHTRSRLKGVFSLASREQVSIMLDGKNMLTEPLKFPQIQYSANQSLSLTFGANFDGQTGALYVFHDNVSDATFRALYEMTAGTNGVVHRRASVHGEWDSRRGDIVRKSKVLDLSMRRDDVEDIVLSQRNKESLSACTVVDLDEEDESFEHSPLSKSAFNSRLYVVWDPRRTENNVALEMHSGAHARMEPVNVQPWTVAGAQDVISSIGGVQALLPIFRSLLRGDLEKQWTGSSSMLRKSLLCSSIPDLFLFLASFVRDHNENAREMLRCGGIDIVEQLLHGNKKLNAGSPSSPSASLMSAVTTFPTLSTLLVESLLALRSACSHYVGLETKIFARLIFNLPLWFGGLGPGVALYPVLIPVLSSVTRKNPEKVRDCVGSKDMTKLIRDLIELQQNEGASSDDNMFQREIHRLGHLQTRLSLAERRHVVEVLLAMLFAVLAVGSTIDDLSVFLHILSTYLESEWEVASKEIAEGAKDLVRSGVRQERYLFTLKACTLLLFLLQARPGLPGLLESFAGACGSVHGGAAWILSAMVNSYCDRTRSLGVRCLVVYIERTSKSPDLPLSLGKPSLEIDKNKVSDGRTIQENTMTLISNVGQGFLNTNVGKGLAAIGPTVRSRLITPSKLTARVVYKLLWHLLKSHRYRMGNWTQSSLIHMVFDRGSADSTASFEYLKDHFLAPDLVFRDSVKVDTLWADSILGDTRLGLKVTIRDSLGIGTVMRLLRFLPDEFTDKWLSHLLILSSKNVAVVEAVSCSVDWQSCLFQFTSEIVEKIEALSTSVNEENSPARKPDGAAKDEGLSNEDQLQKETKPDKPRLEVFYRRLNLSLDLYSELLGHRIREGGDQALEVVEDAASLQRVCLNGKEVFSLIMSRLFANLSLLGVIPIDQSLSSHHDPDSGEVSFLLKRSARLVTDAILSNGAQGMDMSAAVGCWKCLRHLTAITVAISTRLGFGVAELFDYRNLSASAIDEVSRGLHGIRLVDGRIEGVTAENLTSFYSSTNLPPDSEGYSDESTRAREIFRRVCVTMAAQILSLLDVFIFPDSLDASGLALVHGLALVRSTESRIGSAQGPLLNSLIRLSLLLLCHLEPCSVKLLQCSSRLRCFLHWILELIRESEALEGYSAAFNKLSGPFDRLILAIVLQCHRTLGRCGSLLSEIESTPHEAYFESKEAHKKSYRRLLRVALELRDILVTTFERRNEVLRTSLSPEAFEALKDCLEAPPPEPTQSAAATTAPPSKETLVRKLLFSDWVARFQDVEMRGGVSLPEQLQTGEKPGSESSHRGAAAIEGLSSESNEIVGTFEKSLNTCFEKYLEAQRKWAETGAVRDLEFEGDTTLKRLSGRQINDLCEFAKLSASRNAASDMRLRGIDRKVTELWKENLHWKLAKCTDRLGRRVLLVQNRQFNDHAMASYDLLMGMEREKEGRDREERLRKKQELADLMKRNSDAFVPFDENFSADDDDKDHDEADEADGNLVYSKSEESEFDTTVLTSDIDKLDEVIVADENPDINEDTDAWAKVFIWSDSESVVARFDSVMIVALQSVVEGKLLLTTHGLYFHQIGDEINVITREPLSKSAESNNRRWRLSRLTEVHGRRYMLRSQALEVFFSDCHELFLNFLDGHKERNRFYAKLRNSCKVPMIFSPKSLNPRAIFKKSKLTELWRKRKISNFEYLMTLNRMAGRTFNDIAQYPVFPWILSDYTSDKIDLTDSRVYRDLSKPVGALNPDRLSQLLERYNELEQFGFAENEKFLYGSHYSSPGVILHYLIRQEPFTSMAIDLQSGRFDCPDRLFFDLSESWKSCNTSSSDVKELIPEFFTLPEFLLNSNKFPLGTTQRGDRVDDVGLPPWAKGSAHEFVRIHRLALESEHVSKNLHHWVDLVFGYQQRGVEAEAAHNIFHYLSYEGSVDLDKISDELDRKAAESHIQNFGQTPSQLIAKEPHPIRYSGEECWKPLINNMSSTVRLRCHTPAKQYGGKKGGCGSVMKIHVQADTLIVIYSDLKVGTFKWSPKSTTNRLKPDKLRILPNRPVSNSRSVIKRGSAAPQTMDNSGSSLSVGNWSFAVTLGGYEKEQLRRKSVMPSRLASAKDALYTDAASLIVSCGYWDNMVKVHSTDAWKLECSENGGHRGPVRCLAVGQDGGLMVTGGDDCTCRVWLVDHPDMAIALSDGYVQTALGQSTDGDQVLSCCHVLWGHDTPITCLDLSSDLDVTISGSVGGRICLHSIRRGEFVRSIRPPAKPDSPVAKLALENHGRMVVHMGDGGLHTYTVNGHRLCSADAGEQLHDMKIAGEVLVTGGDRCHVYIRDLMTLKVLSGLDLSRHGPVRCISLTPNELNPVSQHLFIGSDDGMISIVDREGEKA